jgi:hypothetical protein
VDERDAAERPLVIDGSAPPIAHSYIHAFAEVVRLHDLVLDKEELPLLLLHFCSISIRRFMAPTAKDKSLPARRRVFSVSARFRGALAKWCFASACSKEWSFVEM